jgi:hypothetical protein
MNHNIVTADRGTHLKIVVVVTVAVGLIIAGALQAIPLPPEPDMRYKKGSDDTATSTEPFAIPLLLLLLQQLNLEPRRPPCGAH